MARKEVTVEVEDWQLPVLRTYLEAFSGLQITRDEATIVEEKALKQRAWQSRLDSLLVPIPTELTAPVGNSYQRLLEDIFSPKSDKRAPKRLIMESPSNTELNELQGVFYGLFHGDDRLHYWLLDAKTVAVIVERYGLKTGLPRSYQDLASDLFMSGSRANQLNLRTQAVLRHQPERDRLIPRFATVEST